MPKSSALSPQRSPLIVILGPTSSGKSALGIKLARKFNGEIISADSRQVYKGMDLGTGKVPKDDIKKLRITDSRLRRGSSGRDGLKSGMLNPEYYSDGIRHYLLDIILPEKQFSAGEFQDAANKAIEKIKSRDKIPFLVGGTPFYIYSVVDDLKFPEVAPNLKLRKQLEKKSAAELLKILKKLDPRRAETIEQQNPRRLIRAIEIVKATGSPVAPLASLTAPTSLTPLIIGIHVPLTKLYKLIDTRLEKRLKSGMLRETQNLLKQKKVTHKRLQEMGLEYRFASDYLRKKISYDEMVVLMKNANHKFAKRQMTWFKTDKRIKWITNPKQAEKLVNKFLKNKI